MTMQNETFELLFGTKFRMKTHGLNYNTPNKEEILGQLAFSALEDVLHKT